MRRNRHVRRPRRPHPPEPRVPSAMRRDTPDSGNRMSVPRSRDSGARICFPPPPCRRGIHASLSGVCAACAVRRFRRASRRAVRLKLRRGLPARRRIFPGLLRPRRNTDLCLSTLSSSRIPLWFEFPPGGGEEVPAGMPDGPSPSGSSGYVCERSNVHA